ncbi:MAG: aminotransferase class V-fold PLP-dependent enzyme [Hyphomonadaceae bacterium]
MSLVWRDEAGIARARLTIANGGMNVASIPTTRAACEALDRADPLAHVRDRFSLPPGVIYLDGHSLGPATHAALKRVNETAEREWAQGLIRSWNDAGWFDLPRTVGAKLAWLIGVAGDEVIVTDSVSVNLFKLATAALAITKSQTIIVEDSEFPTDQYVAEGIAATTHGALMRVGADQGADTLAKTGGVLVKSIVNYRTSLVSDVAEHERIAARSGGLVVWDLSHATGVIDLSLGAHGARLATGCTYKFLNGGPGAPAFVYVRGDLASKLRSPISGWFGHVQPFAFVSGYAPTEGAARFAAGTPGMLSLAALDASLSAFDGADMRAVSAKSRALGDLVIARSKALGLEAISPADGAVRGGHVSIRHEEGYAVVQALIVRGVIPDFRAPDAIRFGVSPLFVRFVDAWDGMDQLADVLATRVWDRPEFKRRAAVT